MKFILQLFAFVIIFPFCSTGQSYQIQWQSCFGGSESDYAVDIVKSGNKLYCLGTTSSNDGDISNYHGGTNDVWLICLEENGMLLWEKTLGGSGSEGGTRIFNASINEFYLLCGSSSSDGDIGNDPYPESTDFWVVKVDSLGNIIWDRILGGNMMDYMWTGTLTTDGGIVAFGWTGSGDGDVSEWYGMYDMWMVKLNSDGEKEWDFSVGTDDFEFGQAIIQTSDGGFLLGGSVTPGEGGNLECEPFNYNSEAMLIKIDANLNIQWQQCYGGSGHDGATALTEASDGYIFGGYAGSNDGDISGWHGEGDIWVVKVDFNGNIIWQKCLGGSRYEGNVKLTLTDDEEILVSGATQSTNGDVTGNHTISEYEHDIWIVKLNQEGELIWEQCFGGIWDEQVQFGFLKKNDHDFVIAGQTDYGPSFDVACTPHGGQYDRDFWVFEIKDTITSVADLTVQIKHLKVYPNPAGNYVCFEYSKVPAPNNGAVIKISNAQGIQIKTLSIQETEGIKVWDTRNQKAGIYYKIKTTSFGGGNV
nr:T9SS type A sorting domain-containing protein [Bacteroidota bacterium]